MNDELNADELAYIHDLPVGQTMNYDDMPEGPELDRLVAERVMGWKECTWKDTPDAQRPNIAFTDGWGAMRVFTDGVSLARGVQTFQPSTNIAHAWEVVEKIRPTACFDLYYINGWVASFDPSGNPNATADTAPLAICRAALKAVAP